MAIKVPRRYECDTEGCTSSEEVWCPPTASVGEGLPSGWRVWAEGGKVLIACSSPECVEVAKASAESARLERIRAREEARSTQPDRRAARAKAKEERVRKARSRAARARGDGE